MRVYKNSLRTRCLSILLMGGICILGTGTMASKIEAAPMVVCAVGTPCTTGGGVTVGGGTLTASTDPTIVNNGNAVSVTGQDQIIPFKFLSSISDARGTGVGWTITASATAAVFGAASSDLFLDATAPVAVGCAGNSTCSNPGVLTVPTGGEDLVTAGPVTLVSAATTQGLGSYNISTLGNFTLPASASSGVSTGGLITVLVTAGP